MPDFAASLAADARRTSLITNIWRRRRELTIAQLDWLLRSSKYRRELAEITVAELMLSDGTVLAHGEPVELAVMRIFRETPDAWLSSRVFIERLQIQRWTAQALLGGLHERGLLLRTGNTSSTRYRLAHSSTGNRA